MFLLNRLSVYLLPTTMSSVTRNHTMDLFHLSKENYKNHFKNENVGLLVSRGALFEHYLALDISALRMKESDYGIHW